MRVSNLAKIRRLKPELIPPRDAKPVGVHTDGRVIYEMQRLDLQATASNKVPEKDPLTGEDAWVKHPTTGEPLYKKMRAQPVYYMSRFVLEGSPAGKVTMNEHFEVTPEEAAADQAARDRQAFGDRLAEIAVERGLSPDDLVTRIIDGLSAPVLSESLQEPSEDLPPTEFPYHQGAGYWLLSNGERIRGKRAVAEEAENALQEAMEGAY